MLVDPWESNLKQPSTAIGGDDTIEAHGVATDEPIGFLVLEIR